MTSAIVAKLNTDSQRALLLEAWKTFEEQHGTDAELAKVQEMMPTTRKRWRKAEDGSGQLEECTWIRQPHTHSRALTIRLGPCIPGRRAGRQSCFVQVFQGCSRMGGIQGWCGSRRSGWCHWLRWPQLRDGLRLGLGLGRG